MDQVKAIIKRWGNSFGVVVPINFMKSECLEEGSEVVITPPPQRKTKVSDIFGMLKGKLKGNTQKGLDKVDKDFWPND